MKRLFFILICLLLFLAYPVCAEEIVDGVPTESGNIIVNPTITGGSITGATGEFTTLSVTQNFNPTKGSDVASANALALGNGNVFDITGVTTINTIATKGVGTIVVLEFDGVLQLTHSNDLFLPTAGNITTAAGDIAAFYEYASGDWRCFNYMRANGTSLLGYYPSGTDVAIADGGTGASTAADAFTALKQDATTSATGVVELSTDAETITGTATDKAVTPANVTAKMSAPGTIGDVTPGTIYSKFATVEKSADTVVLTAAECSGTLITNRGWDGADDQNFTLPAAVAGLKFLFQGVIASGGVADTYFDTEGATTNNYLDGTAVGDGVRIWTQEIAVGESIFFYTFTIDGTNYEWASNTINGVWEDKGS